MIEGVQRLSDWMQSLGLTTHQVQSLSDYMHKIWQANHRLNLVSRRLSMAQLVLDHLADSLVGLPYMPETGLVADLGSGGGFPAVPLAIGRPDLRFHLFEKSPKKCQFLRSLVGELPNLIVRGRLEPDGLHRDTVMVTARAFKSIDRILELSGAYCRGGSFLLYTGRREKIDADLSKAKPAIDRLRVRIVSVSVPGQYKQRHLVRIDPKKR